MNERPVLAQESGAGADIGCIGEPGSRGKRGNGTHGTEGTHGVPRGGGRIWRTCRARFRVSATPWHARWQGACADGSRLPEDEAAWGGLLERRVGVEFDVEGVDRLTGAPAVAGQEGGLVYGRDGHGFFGLVKYPGNKFPE